MQRHGARGDSLSKESGRIRKFAESSTASFSQAPRLRGLVQLFLPPWGDILSLAPAERSSLLSGQRVGQGPSWLYTLQLCKMRQVAGSWSDEFLISEVSMMTSASLGC